MKMSGNMSMTLETAKEKEEAHNNRVMAEAWVMMNQSGFRWKRLVILLGVSDIQDTTIEITKSLADARDRTSYQNCLDQEKRIQESRLRQSSLRSRFRLPRL